MIFTTGNLLTLGIVIVVLILYRQLDRNNRSMDKVRKYGERLKDDLGAFVAGKEEAVKDYAVELDVQQKSAKELLKRLVLTEEQLAAKADAVAKIDERLNSYDTSLDELLRMTDRAQENLLRLREESSFTDGLVKRVSDAKGQFEALGKGLSELELRFERENLQALERVEEAMVAAVKSTVSDLQSTAESIERRVEDHRDAVVKVEQDRQRNLQRDLAAVEGTVEEALERARTKANVLEDNAFAKLKEQALDRSKRFQAAVEEKLALFQEATKTRIADVQVLVKSFKDEWKQDAAELESKQKAFKDEWKRDVSELNGLAKAQRDAWKNDLAAAEEIVRATHAAILADSARFAQESASRTGEAEKTSLMASEAVQLRLKQIQSTVDESINGLQAAMASTAEETEKKTLESLEIQLAAYRKAQAGRFQRLEQMADDVGRLDAELRRSMTDTENRVRQDFALFEKEAESDRDAVQKALAASVDALKSDLGGVEKELTALKERAYENVSAKLKLFEDDFFTDLSKRSEEIDRRLEGWKGDIDSALDKLGADAAESRSTVETTYSEELRLRLAEQSERTVSELERLKDQTGAFEEGIREQLTQSDQSMQAFKDKLKVDLEEARTGAAAATKAEISRHSLAMAELLKKDQRELEANLKSLVDSVEERRADLSERLDFSRRDIDTWQTKFSQQLREADAALEDARRRGRELAAESDERLVAVRSAIQDARDDADTHKGELFSRMDDQARTLDASVKDADRRIKEFVAQTKLFDRADELRVELARRMEDLGADLDRLDQRRSEAAELEAQFVKIKRLEDEVNAKMTRFLSEKRRIELMEADFKRLIQTAQAVDDKLAQVTGSDDTLQALQAQLRRLEDAVGDAEEKVQRIEKKNQILDATNDGIDRNFQALRDGESMAKKLQDDLARLEGSIASVRMSIDKLSADKEKTEAAADKLGTLDRTLAEIEERIEAMQKAREWLARAETRLEEVSKQAQDQVKLMGNLLKEEGRKGVPKDRGAPPIGTRETVVKLSHQGWSIDEIARAVKLSKGEVELILEISPKV